MALFIDQLGTDAQQRNQIIRLRNLLEQADGAITELRSHLEEMAQDLEAAEWESWEDISQLSETGRQRDDFIATLKELLDNVEQTETLIESARSDFGGPDAQD